MNAPAFNIAQADLGPGVHRLPSAVYHSDPAPLPSLSATLAKLITAKSPRHAWHASPRLNPDYESLNRKTFDIGRAAHRAVLGCGDDYVAIPTDLLATNGAASTSAAKAFIADARDRGLTPIKDDEVAQVEAMAKIARARLAEFGIEIDPDRSELAALAEIDGTWCRAMFDHVPADPRSPYFQYDFQVKKQRFHGSTGCKTKRDAQAFIDNLRREIALGSSTLPGVTLGNACAAYWNDKGQHEASGYTTEYQLTNLCRIIGENVMLSAITLTDWRAFIAKRRGEGVSHASINREWQLARRVWRHVADTHAVSTIQWGKLKLDEPAERVRALKADEEKALFEALPDSLRAIVEFAILSGQRKSAVIGLEWDRINWGAGEATIVNKGGNLHSFPLSPAMVQLLLEQPRVDGCPFVFTYVCERPAPSRKDRPRRLKGARYPFTKGGWARKWYKALADAGVSDFRFHDLRHTSATRIIRTTGNLKAAGKLLGHTDIRTTSRYAHVGMEDLRSIMVATESRNSTGQRLTDSPKKRTNTKHNGPLE